MKRKDAKDCIHLLIYLIAPATFFPAENQFLSPVSAETFWKRKSMGDIMCSGEVCQLS